MRLERWLRETGDDIKYCSVRLIRLWWIAFLAAVLALVFELAVWFVPQLLKASREPAYTMQFCRVLGTNTDTACVTVSFQALSICGWKVEQSQYTVLYLCIRCHLASVSALHTPDLPGFCHRLSTSTVLVA